MSSKGVSGGRGGVLGVGGAGGLPAGGLAGGQYSAAAAKAAKYGTKNMRTCQ